MALARPTPKSVVTFEYEVDKVTTVAGTGQKEDGAGTNVAKNGDNEEGKG